MYTTCITCDRPLGNNLIIAHLPVGRSIAFERTHGRLWVICRRCHEWNLTPIEERWEALEECDSVFHRSSVRAVARDIGFAVGDDGTELVRIGPDASRSDIANWRYGKRLRRRRRRLALRGAVLGGTALSGIGLALMGHIGAYSDQLIVGGWCAALAMEMADLPDRTYRRISRRVVARYRPPHNPVVAIRRPDLWYIELVRKSGGRYELVWRSKSKTHLRLDSHDAADLMAVLLPHINWRGAARGAIERATALVDWAEGPRHPDASSSVAPWERVLNANQQPVCLVDLPLVQRLALEMAVAEDVELRGLQGNATNYLSEWRAAEGVAAISDSLLLPAFVTEWLEKRRNPRSGS